jgi:hypothetical protein
MYNMKKIFVWAAAAMMLCAANLQAQPGGYPGGGFPGGGYPGGGQAGQFQMPEQVTDSAYIANKINQLIDDYDITVEQEEKIRPILEGLVSRLNMKMPSFGEQNGERPDYQNMTDAQRREMMNQMQTRMQQMEELRQDRNKAQKEFDKAMKDILDKEQYKAYSKDRKREDRERQSRENQYRGMGGPGGGFGGPGGGMGGPGGGFGGPGGGFGGPGGF